MFADLLRVRLKGAGMALPAWTGVVFVKMHKFMCHGPNQRVRMPDRGGRYPDDVAAVLEQVPAEQ